MSTNTSFVFHIAIVARLSIAAVLFLSAMLHLQQPFFFCEHNSVVPDRAVRDGVFVFTRNRKFSACTWCGSVLVAPIFHVS